MLKKAVLTHCAPGLGLGALGCFVLSIHCGGSGGSPSDAAVDVGSLQYFSDAGHEAGRQHDATITKDGSMSHHPPKDATHDVADGGRSPTDAADAGPSPTDAADASDGATDAGPDSPVSTIDAGCSPGSTSSFTPATYVPAVARQNLCSTSQINEFIMACGDQGTETSCQAWLAANVIPDAGATCGNCIVAPQNNGAEWTDPTGVMSANYAGCIQISDITYGPACAAAYNNVQACEGVACDVACETATSPNAWFKCANMANMGSCGTYASSEATACANDFADGGALATCSPAAASGNANDDLSYIVTLICGP